MSVELKANVLASELCDPAYTQPPRLLANNLLRAPEATVTASIDEVLGEKENAYLEGFTYDFWRTVAFGTDWLRASIAAGVITDEHLLLSGQDGDVRDIAVADNGARLYVLGSAKVYAYVLSTPFDVATAIYEGSAIDLDISAEDTNPQGLAISKTGLKLYMVGATNDKVYSYTLAVPFDLGTATNDGGADLDISGDDITPTGVEVSSDGLKLYVAGTTGVKVYSYTMSTAFDLSTATTDASDDLDVTEGGVAAPGSIVMNEAGTRLYILGTTNVIVYLFHLGTPFDLSSALYAGSQHDLDVSNEDASPRGLTISPDGAKAYVSGIVSDKVQTYTIGVAFNAMGIAAHDLPTAGGTVKAQYGRVLSLDVSGLTPVGLTISEDGLQVYVLGNIGSDTVYQYTLAVAYDLSTATYQSVNDLDVSGQDPSMKDIAISFDGTVLFVLGDTAAATVHAYDLSTPYDLSSAVYNATDDLSVAAEDTAPQGIDISSDGLKLVMVGTTTPAAYFYTLSVANDLSTATNDGTDDFTISEDTDPYGVAFSTDGLKLYVLGRTGDALFQYTFGTAYDGSTLSYDTVTLVVSTEDSAPRGIALAGDNLHLYMVGQAGNQVYGYTMATAKDMSDIDYMTWLDASSEFIPKTTAPILIQFSDVVALHVRLHMVTVDAKPNIGVVCLGSALKFDAILSRSFAPAHLSRVNVNLPVVSEGGQYIGRSIVANGALLSVVGTAAGLPWLRAQWELHVDLLDNFPFFFIIGDVPLVDGISEGEVFYGWPTTQPSSSYVGGVYGTLFLTARGIIS